jgi:hypothetical protein
VVVATQAALAARRRPMAIAPAGLFRSSPVGVLSAVALVRFLRLRCHDQEGVMPPITVTS